MSHTTPSEADIARTLSDLKLSSKAPQKPKAKPKSAPVADSWDEDLSGSDTETETETSSLSRATSKDTASKLSPINTASSDEPPNPPPPTPASPTPFEFPDNTPYAQQRNVAIEGNRARGGADSPQRRPEKTTAVAGRLIAGALGVRPPKRTEEEREFDKAMREKERKRREDERNREKLDKEKAAERARSVWED